jgi:transposase
MREAARFVSFDRVLADMGFDAEPNHRLCREELGIRLTVIPVNMRGFRIWPRARYRRQMKRRFFKRVYGNRAQVESVISRHKRRLGSALRARKPDSQARECLLRVLTHNIMILSFRR